MRFSLLLISCAFLSFGEQSFNVNLLTEEVPAVNTRNYMIGSDELFRDSWDCLPQPLFWKEIMQLSPDSCLINVAATRVILEKKSFKEWSIQTEAQKSIYKDKLRKEHNLPEGEQLFVTTGKNDFYLFDDVYPSIAKGIAAFEMHGVDPWYAQAILLIESPGQLKKSNAGAYGAFQLMPGVARSQGLIVNKQVDERKDFDKSAMGSARLIQRICIPEAKKILDAHHLTYKETDIWFRLFVLHVYHAGAMNVNAVVAKIAPKVGSQALIQQMWQTSAANFGNSSQNYTQLALASQLILSEMVDEMNKGLTSAIK